MSGQYFEPSPQSGRRPGDVRFFLDGVAVRLATDAGVFSPRRIDPGTAVLLHERNHPATSGTLVDVGCGYGPIAIALARRSPDARILAVDVNERARELCRDNVDRLGLDNVEVLAPEEVPADLRVDEIWSNPPVRIGKPAMYALVLEWLGRLAPDGAAELVIGKNLGGDSLHAWLDEQGFAVTRTGSRKGYRLLRVVPRSD